jgi:hypothetical protein
MKIFITCPHADLHVIQILETMKSSSSSPLSPILPTDQVKMEIASLDTSEVISSEELSCPDDHFGAPEYNIHRLPRFEHETAKIVELYPA